MRAQVYKRAIVSCPHRCIERPGPHNGKGPGLWVQPHIVGLFTTSGLLAYRVNAFGVS